MKCGTGWMWILIQSSGLDVVQHISLMLTSNHITSNHITLASYLSITITFTPKSLAHQTMKITWNHYVRLKSHQIRGEGPNSLTTFDKIYCTYWWCWWWWGVVTAGHWELGTRHRTGSTLYTTQYSLYSHYWHQGEQK